MIIKKIGVIFVVLSLLAIAQADLNRIDELLREDTESAEIVFPKAGEEEHFKATNNCDEIDCDEEEMIARNETLKGIMGDSSEDDKEFDLLELPENELEEDEEIDLDHYGGHEQIDEELPGRFIHEEDLDDLGNFDFEEKSKFFYEKPHYGLIEDEEKTEY